MDLERELRTMLQDRAGDMPDAYEPTVEFTTRVRRRRASKQIGTAASSLLAIVLVVGLVVNATGSKRSAPQIAGVHGGDVQTVHCSTNRTPPLARPLPTDMPKSVAPGVNAPELAHTQMYVSQASANFSPQLAVLAPAGWACRPLARSIDGFENVAIGPANQPAGAGPVSLEAHTWSGDIPIGPSDVASTACNYVTDPAVKRAAAKSVTPSSCTPIDYTGVKHVTPDITEVTQPSDGSRFVYAWTSTSRSSGAFTILGCRNVQPAAPCDAIVNDYVARLQGISSNGTTTTTVAPVPATVKPIATINAQGAMTGAGGDVWILNSGGNGADVTNATVTRYSGSDGKKIASIPVNGTLAHGITSDGNRVYVTGGGDGGFPDVTTYTIDVTTNRVVSKVTMGVGPDGAVSGPVFANGAGWFGTQQPGTGALERVDPATGRVVAKIALPAEPHAIAVVGNGRVLVGLANGSVAIVDPAKNTVEVTLQLPALGSTGIAAIVAQPNDTTAAVVAEDSSVFMVQTSLPPIVTRDLSLPLPACRYGGTAVATNGTTIFASCSGENAYASLTGSNVAGYEWTNGTFTKVPGPITGYSSGVAPALVITGNKVWIAVAGSGTVAVPISS